MVDIAELLVRVEAATGPDRGLDAEIDATLRIGKPKMEPWAWANFDTWRPAPPIGSGMVELVHSDGSGGLIWQSQPFTASIDAAVALVEKVLPGWGWNIDRYGKTADASVIEIMPHVDDRDRETHAVAPTAPLAILAALLRALPASPVHPQGS